MIKLSIVIPLLTNRRVEFVAMESINKQGKNVKLILEESNENASVNRNRGVKKAKTFYVAFINAHTVVADNWLQYVNDFFNKHPEIDIVGGPQLNLKNDSFFAKVSGYALSSVFGAANMSNRYKITQLDLDADEFKLTSANLICKKKVFEKIKFDENIYPGEDPKFISDAKMAGFKIAYSPDIIVYNKRRDNIFGLIKQIYTYGKMRTKKDSFKDLLLHPVFFGPSGFLIYLLVLPALLFFSLWGGLFFVIYFSLAIMFAFVEAIKNNNFFAFFFLPFIFLSIHLSYGAGFLIGLFNKVFNKN